MISVARLISGSMLAFGPVVGGLLAEIVGTTTALLILAAWQLSIASAAAATKPLRDTANYRLRPEPTVSDG